VLGRANNRQIGILLYPINMRCGYGDSIMGGHV
jgi:hypothetical protein